jgi:hypothetical protein
MSRKCPNRLSFAILLSGRVYSNLIYLAPMGRDPNVDVPSITFNLGGGATFRVLSPFQAYYYQVIDPLYPVLWYMLIYTTTETLNPSLSKGPKELERKFI